LIPNEVRRILDHLSGIISRLITAFRAVTRRGLFND
jgi:hypothetical protein